MNMNMPDSDRVTRYELPPGGITLLGYVVRRMHKTAWLMPIPALLERGRYSEVLAKLAWFAAAASTSFGPAHYQPEFDRDGDEIEEADPATGMPVRAVLASSRPHFRITTSVVLPGGGSFSGAEEITGTTVGLRGLGMPAPSTFRFQMGGYAADLGGLITSELALSLLGRTRIRAYGSLRFDDSMGNAGALTFDRERNVRMEINGTAWLGFEGRKLGDPERGSEGVAAA